MAIERHMSEYNVTAGSGVVDQVTHKDGTFSVEVRTSGWVEMARTIYGWDTVVTAIPPRRLSEPMAL
jgi:hypothetical protein